MNKHEENFLKLLDSAIMNKDKRTLRLCWVLARRNPDALAWATNVLIKGQGLGYLGAALDTFRHGDKEWAKAYVLVETEARMSVTTGAFSNHNHWKVLESQMHPAFLREYKMEKEKLNETLAPSWEL